MRAQLDKGKGPVATVSYRKVRFVLEMLLPLDLRSVSQSMMDDKGRRVKEAGPSTPVEILGFNEVPNAGEVFVVSKNEKEARSFAETFISQNRMKMLEETKSKMSLDDLFNQIKEGSLKELDIVVKADVQGSVEAMKQSLLKLSNEEVVVKIIHGGVGAINESDVTLASASNAIIIGFNVRPDAAAKGDCGERERRRPSVPCHLQCHRRRGSRYEGDARSGIRGTGSRSCGSTSDIQGFRSRYNCWCLCAGWYFRARLFGKNYP